jgi:hypothetical protein
LVHWLANSKRQDLRKQSLNSCIGKSI